MNQHINARFEFRVGMEVEALFQMKFLEVGALKYLLTKPKSLELSSCYRYGQMKSKFLFNSFLFFLFFSESFHEELFVNTLIFRRKNLLEKEEIFDRNLTFVSYDMHAT